MKIRFLGVGDEFGSDGLGNTGLALESDQAPGQYLLLNCGLTVPQDLQETYGIGLDQLGALAGAYISDTRFEKVAALPWLARARAANQTIPTKPLLLGAGDLLERLWNETLKGGMEVVEGDMCSMTSYFDVRRTSGGGVLQWAGINMQLVAALHVVGGFIWRYSYGLELSRATPDPEQTYQKIYWTGAAKFESSMQPDYDDADLILQDCETQDIKTDEHAHYDDLNTLSEETKAKMWLCGYNQSVPSQQPVADGFIGFAQRQQEIEF